MTTRIDFASYVATDNILMFYDYATNRWIPAIRSDGYYDEDFKKLYEKTQNRVPKKSRPYKIRRRAKSDASNI